ncbi:MAG TPA: alpha/beta fold hydrolase [Candidatus Acidoferrales bacterium]|nr:alpha/beta fold hydrolase [Candidatus Acidoferrales bacterium]
MRTIAGLAPVEGTRLHFEVAGEGPAVVLLHGRGLGRRMWQPQIEAFASGFRVIAYDLRGQGDSPSGTNAYSHADDLARLLDHLGLERAVLIGCSMGGGAAINFAVQHPRRVRALIVAGSSLGGHRWSPAFAATLGSLARIAAEQGAAAATEAYLATPLFAGMRALPDGETRLRAIVRPEDGARWNEPDLGRPLVPPARERLGAIAAPTLVIVGERDVEDMQAIAEILGREIAGARTVKLAGLGHLPSLEDPASFNRVVREFLLSLPD